ncbi:transmembrane protein 134 [Cylas formicarius]|uniref:transmembrane protein 134 n=1 Tax=Cylas formicarius TaxID=197179 RepID=UPI002958C0F2|nr:transmembrane protein 134 [Cylas formicarius]
MSSQFSFSGSKQKRFSIDDAFEEETDEAIKVYGSTDYKIKNNKIGQGDSIGINIDNGQGYKIVNDTSRDSDSLIQDYYECSSEENLPRSCFKHPKVRENWRMVLAATTLLIIGVGLLITGTLTLSEPNSGLQASVFLLAGFICFIPGAYHVVYIYLAAKGKRGYHFHNLPLFT